MKIMDEIGKTIKTKETSRTKPKITRPHVPPSRGRVTETLLRAMEYAKYKCKDLIALVEL
jgi:hypothetical protein